MSPGGFLSGLMTKVGPHLEDKYQQQLALDTQRKSGEYSTYWNSMQAAATRLSELKQKPDLTDEENAEAQRLASQYAWSEGQLNKLTKGSKPLSAAFEKVGGFVKQILSKPSPKGQLQPPQQGTPAAPASAPAPDANAPEGGMDAMPMDQPAPASPQGKLQPPAPIPAPQPSMQSAMALSQEMTPLAMKRRADEAERQRRGKIAKDSNLTEREKYEFIETGRMPSAPAVGTRKQVRFKLADGKEVDAQWDPKTGGYFDNANDPFEIPEGAQLIATKTSAARPTIIASDFVTMANARKLKDQGIPFLDAGGKDIDLSKVPDDMVMQKIHYADGRTVYEPRNINDKVVTVGNVRYAVNPAEVQKLQDGSGTALGVANAGATSQRESRSIDPATGAPIAETLNSSRTPQTTGVVGRPAPGAPPATAAPPAGAATAPGARPTSPISPSTGRPVGAPPPLRGGAPRPLVGMTPGQFNQALNRITPVREAATQIFGDPSQPDMKSMLDFAHLADNPQSRDRIGKALNLTFSGLEQAAGEAHVTAGVGPVGVHAGGGVIQILENYFGVPSKLAAQSNSIMQQAVKDLTPEEREAYDATMATFATMVGLRSLTKASAAQASVRSIEQEIPTIGRFTASKDQYIDRLQHIAEIVVNGTKGIPQSMWDQTPGLSDRIQNLPKAMQQLKQPAPSPKGALAAPGSLPKPAKSGETASDAVMQSYLRANGRKVEAARAALTKAGYVIPN